MPATLTDDVLENSTAVSLARATAVAFRRAKSEGFNKEDDLLSVKRELVSDSMVWRFNFGHRPPPFRRGGDFIVDVDPTDGVIVRELHGQ